MRCAPAGQAHPRETKARRPAEPKRHSQPKSAPAAKAAAAAPGRIAAHTRDTGQAPSRNPSGTANPNAHRRRSRRSSIWQDSRTHARQQPMHPAETQAAQPAQKRTGGKAAAAAPSGTTRQREIKGPDVRIRQNKPHPTRISGPRQPAPGSGEPRKRLKLRSAMHNDVSCLGMTTLPIPST